MRKLIPTLMILFSGLSSFAQSSNLTNSLLWRISGNGLSRPSYLYGTMHLTDKRVFQLGDSVYKALEQTEGFAAELDMNRIGTQMINQFIKESEEKSSKEPVKVKETVSAETWEKYKLLLEKKLNKKADKITVDDLEKIESRLQSDMMRKGDMPTFLDAWLFGQARNQGKWVGGIEDIEDQLEHVDDIESKIQLVLFDDDYYRTSLDWFIKVYTDQKLDTIDALMYREADGRKDFIMIKRNLKMARRMDSLSAIRSTLFAVGAAHLPGDSGVVTLLRNRGFTVSPVFSSKKVGPEKYISKKVEADWFPVSIRDSLYALQMPGVGEVIEMFELMGLDLKMFFDISLMKLYMTINMGLPEERLKLGADSLYNGFRDSYADGGKLLNEKKVFVNGLAGKEYRISTDEGEMQMQIFLTETEQVIVNMVLAFSGKSLGGKETEKFFQSFVFNKDKPKPEKVEKAWNFYGHPEQSFTIEMPGTPKEKKDVVSTEGKVMYEWQSIDVNDQMFYGVNVSVMKEGMFAATPDSAYFISLKENIKSRFADAIVKDSSFIIHKTYPGYTFSVNGKIDNELFETKILALSRGGISYYLYAVYLPGNAGEKKAERFLNSFKLLPYNYPEWKPFTSPDKSFTTTLPFAMKEEEHEEDEIYPDQKRFIQYDSLAFVTAYVDRYFIPNWFWYSSDTAFLRFRADLYTAYDDSVTDYKLENIGHLKTVSFTLQKPGNNLVKKVKLVLNGNEIYELFGNFAKQDLPDKYNRFVDDFKVLAEKQTWDRSQPKANELVAMLRNADLQKVKELNQWWHALEFTGADIPSLQKMLLKIYPDFDSTYYGSLNKKIFDKIEFLDSNHTTVEFIKNNYGLIQPEDDYAKGFIISYLADINTSASYSTLKECLTKYPFTLEKVPYFAYSFYDSLSLVATLFPELMKLAGSESLWDQVASTTSNLLDSNLLIKSAIKEYGKYFIETAKRELQKEKNEIEESSYSYSSLIKLLGVIASPEAIAMLRKFEKFNAREIKFRTFIALLESNQPADNRTAFTLGTIDEYRHDFYDELKRINKLKFFPANSLSQRDLGRSKVFAYATEEDEVPGMITDAGERTILYKGKQQKFYLYKVPYSLEDDTKYLGIAGPYSTNPKDFSSTHSATGIYWQKEFDAKKIDEFFKEYLASFEEEKETFVEEDIMK